MRMIASIGALLWQLLSVPVLACMCSSGDPPAAFNRANAVFIGTVMDGAEKFSVTLRDGTSLPVEAGQTRIAVSEVFKGEIGSEVSVTVVSDRDNTCGPYGLRRGQQYVFYAHAREGDPKLSITGCSRTRPLASNEAREDLEFLRNLPPPGSGGMLRGTVHEDRFWRNVKPVAGIPLQIHGPQQRLISAISAADGSFMVRGLRPGKYRVRPQPPSQYHIEDAVQEVDISDRGAADVAFWVRIDSRLLVRVADRKGQPYNHGALLLLPENAPHVFPEYVGATGSAGSFQINGVPPGEYLLYLDLPDPDGLPGRPGQQFYYPGTFDRAAATPIELGFAESKRGFEFRLPEAFELRSVTGRVIWPDGKPASGAVVELRCPSTAGGAGQILESFSTQVETDADGRFRLDAVANETYWLEAAGSYQKSGDANQGHVESPRVRIVAGTGAIEQDLVLSSAGYTHRGCDP